jgi:apolipoprotein N-acyltransferase
MSPPPPPLAEAVPRSSEKLGLESRPATHPIWPALGSAILLWTTFPPVEWSWLAWVALVPLFVLIKSRRSRLSIYFGAWAGGMVFWTLAIQWVRLSDESAWLGWLVMALALSVFWPLFLALARVAVLHLRLPSMVAAPIIWVALEYVRAYFMTGFPWYYLAHSQHAVLAVIQIADLTGSLGVSVIIALVNAWVVDVLSLPLLRPSAQGPRLTPQQSRRLGWVVALLALTIGYGSFRLASARFHDGPRVALLQSSLIQSRKDKLSHERLIAIYESLLARAVSGPEKPELIVWPETSYPYGYIAIDPAIDKPTLDRQVKQLLATFTVEKRLEQRDLIARQLHGWADQLDIPMLVGSTTTVHRPERVDRYNSALLLLPGETAVQSFHKLHLVPFGEYVPLISVFPWLTVLTPYHGSYVPSLSFGNEPKWLEMGKYRIAAAICFEDTVPQVVRRYFHEAKDGRHPDIVLNLSNDGWFKGSSEHDMHLAVSVFRAVEHRVPLARAANCGVSAIVDGNGRVLSSLPTLKEGVLSGIVPLDDREALYSSVGDWLGQSCLLVTIGLVPLAFIWKRRDRGRPV